MLACMTVLLAIVMSVFKYHTSDARGEVIEALCAKEAIQASINGTVFSRAQRLS